MIRGERLAVLCPGECNRRIPSGSSPISCSHDDRILVRPRLRLATGCANRRRDRHRGEEHSDSLSHDEVLVLEQRAPGARLSLVRGLDSERAAWGGPAPPSLMSSRRWRRHAARSATAWSSRPASLTSAAATTTRTRCARCPRSFAVAAGWAATRGEVASRITIATAEFLTSPGFAAVPSAVRERGRHRRAPGRPADRRRAARPAGDDGLDGGGGAPPPRAPRHRARRRQPHLPPARRDLDLLAPPGDARVGRRRPAPPPLAVRQRTDPRARHRSGGAGPARGAARRRRRGSSAPTVSATRCRWSDGRGVQLARSRRRLPRAGRRGAGPRRAGNITLALVRVRSIE